MKKLIVLFIAVTSSLSLYSQSSWGVTGGKVFNNFYNPNKDVKFDTHTSSRSFSAGIFYQRNICTHSSLRLSLSYDDKTTRNNSKKRTDLRYLTFEAMSILPLTKNGKLTLGSGAYISHLLSAEKVMGEGEREQVIPLQYTRKFDAGFSLNIGYQVTNRLELMTKANIGLVSLSSTKNPPRIEHGPLDCDPLPDDINYAGNGGNYGFGQFYSYYNRSITLGINYTLK